jgi:pyruvate,water dikinase
MNKYFIVIFLTSCFFASAQKKDNESIKSLINSYKKDPRGPYNRIKWFCDDGTEREPKDPCPDKIGGIQHADYKSSLLDLRTKNHLFFGDILAAESVTSFLDKSHNFSHLKQYQLNRYLFSVDEGWVLKRAQYYRGAIQSEDEEEWGKDFFLEILKDDQLLNTKFYLIRQALKDVPHNGDDNTAQLMRSQSKQLSEEFPKFMDIRIKIHGQPNKSDIQLVENYISKNKGDFNSKNVSEFNELVKTMNVFFAPMDLNRLKNDLEQVQTKNETYQSLLTFFSTPQSNKSDSYLVAEISNLLYQIKQHITSFKSSSDRLIILDISNQLEKTLLIEAQNLKTTNLLDLVNKINYLSCASVGTGLIENWEYVEIQNELIAPVFEKNITVETLNIFLNTARSVVEWSSAMPKANYLEIVNTYNEFEPLAYGFIDDKVRSSVALSLGDAVSLLGSFVARESNINNNIEALDNQTSVRGLNPGYAMGKLVVVDGNPDDVEVNSNNIYIFERPPSDLKPVAGIMTVSEGNLVSHVQLLARNLGIPNAALSYNDLKTLKKLDGETIFYAVSNKGNVILKEADDMTSTEESLFDKTERSKNVIEVPVEKIRLDVNKVINMRDVDASDSGRLCGPKAANLGALKQMFPEQVVEGLIIPFGIFRDHMNQCLDRENGVSYWDYLSTVFSTASQMKENNTSDAEIESYQLEALSYLKDAIINMPLDDAFVTQITSQFKTVFKSDLGETPVFLRSDTNMEDLKEFTGAGLNLTLFNILDKDEILRGIKRVWASPYTERSFKWRQKYLSNPENVFPSILIIPSVDVDYSGVMITKGINSGNDNDLTVAFSLGAGGAVDGQSAETRLITDKENILLAPARQADYIRLPKSGSTQPYSTSFNAPILNEKNIKDIRELATEIRKNMSDEQAYDVEFGFKDDKLWLFQIRPFVENKQAKSSDYLTSITPKVDSNKQINLKSNLN